MIKIESEREKILERLDLVINFFRLSVEDITKILGYTNVTSYYNARSKLTIVTYNTFTKLIEALPEVNYDWLLTGRGTMTGKESTSEIIIEDDPELYKTKMDLIYEAVLRIEDKIK